MHTAAMTQPLATPWRHAAAADRLHIELERVVSLVVEDHHAPVPRPDARVFEVEHVARVRLLGAAGDTLETRTFVAGDDRAVFAARLREAVTWATTLHPGLAVVVAGVSPAELDELRRALADVAAIATGAAATQARSHELDRRRRVA